MMRYKNIDNKYAISSGIYLIIQTQKVQKQTIIHVSTSAVDSTSDSNKTTFAVIRTLFFLNLST